MKKLLAVLILMPTLALADQGMQTIVGGVFIGCQARDLTGSLTSVFCSKPLHVPKHVTAAWQDGFCAGLLAGNMNLGEIIMKTDDQRHPVMFCSRPVDPIDYGAVCDGVHDDSKAFETAEDLARKYGWKVRKPDNCFPITSKKQR